MPNLSMIANHNIVGVWIFCSHRPVPSTNHLTAKAATAVGSVVVKSASLDPLRHPRLWILFPQRQGPSLHMSKRDPETKCDMPIGSLSWLIPCSGLLKPQPCHGEWPKSDGDPSADSW